LQGRSSEEIAKELPVLSSEAERMVRLLEYRAGRLAMELENLFAKGMWALTRVDDGYPAKLRDTLKHQAPSVLFGARATCSFSNGAAWRWSARGTSTKQAPSLPWRSDAERWRARMAVVSGGARGTDRIAMDGALDADGVSLGVLADSLEATIRKSDVRDPVLEGRLLLVTPYGRRLDFR
jgi:predicted Rossmann fold nucleotide-binding protein DprA/Smf involved in DNA uptake